MTYWLFSDLRWWEPLAAIIVVTGVAYVQSRKATR